MVAISVVILSYNRLSDISQNLVRLLDECRDDNEFQIIVVDNNSKDGTREFLLEISKRFPSLVLVCNDRNAGVGGGRNAGFSRATRQFIVALDDDTAITADDLRRVPSLFAEHPETGLLAFRVVHPHSGELQNPHGDKPCPVANHHGAGFAFRREIYEKLGGISHDCDYGADELDFAIRAHAAGWKLRYTPEVTVFHNSMSRDSAQEQWRLERWIFNFVRLFYTFFPMRMAFVHTCRFALPLLGHWYLQFGRARISCAMKAISDGRSAGRLNHRQIPLATVRYYSDRHLRPDIGNVPLLERLWRKLRRAHNRRPVKT